MCVTIKNTTDGCHNKQKKRKLADIVRLDFNKYVVRTTNPVTISEHVYYESVLNMYVIYKMTVK